MINTTAHYQIQYLQSKIKLIYTLAMENNHPMSSIEFELEELHKKCQQKLVPHDVWLAVMKQINQCESAELVEELVVDFYAKYSYDSQACTIIYRHAEYKLKTEGWKR